MTFGMGSNNELTQKYDKEVQNDIRTSTHIYKQTNIPDFQLCYPCSSSLVGPSFTLRYLHAYIFSLRLPPHWPGYILRLVSGGGANSLRSGGHYFFIYDCNRFYGLCFTLRANVILSGHGYYKLIVGHPLCRGRYRRVGMGGGGFSVSGATLNRFFSLHYFFPFILCGCVIVHLAALHRQGSNNPLGLKSDYDKNPFHPYYALRILWVC